MCHQFKFLFISLFGVFLSVIWYSCSKDFSEVAAPTTELNNSFAYLKVVDVSPNFFFFFNGTDTFNVLVNGKKISGFTLSYNKMYPYAVNSTTNKYTDTYAAVSVGSNTIQLAMGVNKLDSVVYATLHVNMVGGQRYSLLITDSLLNGSKDSSRMFVRDDYKDVGVVPNIPLDGFLLLRYAHLVLNDTGSMKTDLYSYAQNKAVFTNIRPDSISQFALYGYNYTGVDTFYVLRSIPAGTPTPAFSQRKILAKIAVGAAITGSGITPVGRAFTVMYKGDVKASGAKAPNILTYIH